MMVIELTIMALVFLVLGVSFGYTIGKVRDNINIQLPDWMTYTFSMFRK